MANGHPNVTVVLRSDFSQYPPEILGQLKGAEGCVWALGVSANDVKKECVHLAQTDATRRMERVSWVNKTADAAHREYKRIALDYPLAAAKAFSTLFDLF